MAIKTGIQRCTIEPLVGFAVVTLELARDSGVIDLPPDGVTIRLTFNVKGSTLDQIEDAAMRHGKALLEQMEEVVKASRDD